MEGIKRLFRVLAEPGTVFEEAKVAPKVVLPILLLTLLVTIVLSYYAFNVDAGAVLQQQLELSGKMDQIPADRMDDIIAMQSKIMKWSMPIGAAVATPLMMLLTALYLFVMAKIFATETSYGQSLAVVTYSAAPTILWVVVAFAIMMISDFSTTMFEQVVPSNLSYFFSADTISPKLFVVLKSIDFFGIWKLILMILGFSIVTGTSRAKSAAVVLIPWALLIGIGTLFVG